jgi:hypothetical protein
VGVHDAAEVAARLGPQLPDGLSVLGAEAVHPRAPSIGEALRTVHYAAEFAGDAWSQAALSEKVDAFHALERSVVTRTAPPKNRQKRQQKIAGGKQREINLKQIVTHLAIDGPGRVAFSLKADPSGSARPSEVLAAIFGDGAPPGGVKVLKEGVSLAKTEPAGKPPGQPRLPRYLDA